MAQPAFTLVSVGMGGPGSDLARHVAYVVAVGVVASDAAWNSYWHMAAVALLGHQDAVLAYSLPLSVDGMLLVATLAMAEDKANARHPRGWARFAFWLGATVSIAANIASVVVHHGLDPLSIAVSAWPPVALLVVVEILAKPGRGKPAANGTTTQPPPLATAAESRPSQPPPGVRHTVEVDLSGLLEVARAARDALREQGLPLTRDSLAAQLRADGYPMRNARVSALLNLIKDQPEPLRA